MYEHEVGNNFDGCENRENKGDILLLKPSKRGSRSRMTEIKVPALTDAPCLRGTVRNRKDRIRRPSRVEFILTLDRRVDLSQRHGDTEMYEHEVGNNFDGCENRENKGDILLLKPSKRGSRSRMTEIKVPALTDAPCLRGTVRNRKDRIRRPSRVEFILTLDRRVDLSQRHGDTEMYEHEVGNNFDGCENRVI